MPLYGVAQSGSSPTPGLNLSAIGPGDRYTLFDGTETAANGLKSVAFSRAMLTGAADAGTTFYVSGAPAASTMDIQGSNQDLDTTYLTLTTLTPDANGNAAYTDVGRAAYYRAKISAYSSGAMPVVIVQR